ncbi:MFS transporter [Ostreiculturibacter nitratireducens]|uniref:MFS transporter n=1 Tax=Ostreiculturibacter nitratireducens TaxID=3075226 RepID=UPI0031B56E47
MASKLPKGVIALGFTSLFMDISSEMIHGLLPLFLTATLGASALVLGVIEGVAEATAQILKVFSGALSDRIRRRKPLAVLGYGLSAATKPLFALAGTPWLVMGARFADRVGKGIRGAPRDALIADIVEEAHRGAAYGLRQSLDTVGAFVGPIAAMVILWASGGDIRLVFAVAVIPAALAVLILVRGVREPALPPAEGKKPRLDRNSLAALGRPFWVVVAVGAVMTMARISEAFLILRANDAGLPVALAPLVLVMMNVVYSLSAWPLGALSDEPGKRGLLLRLGFAVLILSHIVLALAPGLGTVMAGVALWGLHMGLTQGLLAAEVAAHAPARLRGTAFGVFNLVTGLTLLVANGIAGAIWAGVGAEVMFLAGAGAAALGLLGMGVRVK